MLFRASQAAAFLDDRDYVKPDDVKNLAPQVLGHRVILTAKARYDGATSRDVIKDILKDVKVPT